MQFRRLTAVGIALATAASLGACTSASPGGPRAGGTSGVSDTSTPTATPTDGSATGTPTPTPSPTPTTPPAVLSLSGLPGTAGKKVIAVKIDNTYNGRPQSGLNDADLVYVEQVEGGITRLMAVFQSKFPKRIGPVRSGRQSDLEILAAYGKVGLAYSGAQPGVERLIKASPQITVEEDFKGYFFRDGSRRMPYNLYLDPAKLLKAKPQITTANDIGLHFSATLAGGTRVTSVKAVMSFAVTIGFTYDRAHRRWLESQSGTPIFVAGGQRVWTTNVLIQEVTVVPSRFKDVNHNNTPLSHTVGAGKFRILRPDGHMFTGTWTRKSKHSRTVYKDSHGVEITLAPGRTWILLVKKGNKVTVN